MHTKPLLVLEDEFLIAIDIEDTLKQAGFLNVQTFSRCKDANEWLQHNTPALAVLDIRLSDGDCTPTALILDQRSVPIIIYTGSRPAIHMPEVLQRAVWLDKIVTPDDFVAVVKKGLGIFS